MLGSGGRGQLQKLLNLADAELIPLSQSAENTDTIGIGQSFGDGEKVPHGILSSSFRDSTKSNP